MLYRVRFVFLAVLLVTALSLALLPIFNALSKRAKDTNRHAGSHSHLKFQKIVAESPKEWDTSRFIKGAPTRYFRDNLLDNVFYITAWNCAGFTNQFMSSVNMIYQGWLSNRVPIIPPFGPDRHHVSQGAGMIPFGDIFNLTRASEVMGIPLLEWRDVKHLPSTNSTEAPEPSEREQIGCWSARPETTPRPARVRSSGDHLKLDVSYTRAPREARNNQTDDKDDFLVFSKLVPYIFPKRPLRGHFELMEKSPLGHELPPDEHLTCFDFLYYTTSSSKRFEWEVSWSPAWLWVAAHLHFTDQLVDTVAGYLGRAFESPSDDLPLFIAIHMRRGDFAKQCSGDCFVPQLAFEEKVASMRQDLLEKHNKIVTNVIIMSDEKDPKFWEQIHNLGWVRFDHAAERTVEKYGEWYPAIFDIVAQSMAAGFIGTAHSTFSLVSKRRVEDWNDGPTALLEHR